MGESRRRKTKLGDRYGQPEPFIKGVPSISKDTAAKFASWTTTGAWTGIILMIVGWLTIRFVGPGFGWWTLTN